MAAVIPPPPTHNSNGSLHPTSHAVDRSVEFLSAARTSLRISQQRYQRRLQQSSSSYRDDGGDEGPPLPEWLADLDPADLHLYRHPPPSSYGRDGDGDDGDGGFGRYDAPALVRDSQALLRLLDSHLSDLHALVRRRGHTNDPTIEIQGLMERFQEGAREVKDVCDSLRLAGTRPPRDCDGGARSSSSSSSQRRKHYEMLSLQLEAQARERTDALKRELETRSRVLRDQSHRRKLLASGVGRGGVGAAGVGSDPPTLPAGAGMAHRPATRMPAQNGAASLSAASSQFRSPLFTATSGGMVAATATAGRNAPPPSAPPAYRAYAGYGGSSSASASAAAAGYGGASTTSAVPPAMGMRQRRQQGRSNVQIDSGGGDDCEDKYNKSSEPSSSSSSSSMQQQISQRREQRATHARAQQARIAERSIAELGVMFTKMSTLISQQGEVLERIEDDVEAAGMDIDAGHDELVKVYGMTKGNRGLILKVFGILIFLIIFMKLY